MTRRTAVLGLRERRCPFYRSCSHANLKTAKALGTIISNSILVRADRAIE